MIDSSGNIARGAVIATAFVVDEPGAESAFPQVGRRSSSLSFQRVYWRCIACFFVTSGRCNPTARLLLFCNMPPPRIGLVDFAAILNRLGVEIASTPFTQREANVRLSSFGNVIYTFDVLAAAEQHYPGGRVTRLDPDCVWRRGKQPGESMALHLATSLSAQCWQWIPWIGL